MTSVKWPVTASVCRRNGGSLRALRVPSRQTMERHRRRPACLKANSWTSSSSSHIREQLENRQQHAYKYKIEKIIRYTGVPIWKGEEFQSFCKGAAGTMADFCHGRQGALWMISFMDATEGGVNEKSAKTTTPFIKERWRYAIWFQFLWFVVMQEAAWPPNLCWTSNFVSHN